MQTSTNTAGLVTTYAYNALGQRVKKFNTNGTTYFVYDEQGLLRGTYDASGNPIEELIYLESRPVADVRGTSIYRVLTDPLSTPRKLIDGMGTTVWSWDGKEAFGASAPTGSITFNLRFPGQYADLETGLFNNGFRDYAPSWGRYIERDPIGLLGGWNTYGYVGGNPLSGTDPRGNVLVITGTAKNDADTALTYLGQSPTMMNVIKALQQSSSVYTIDAIDGNEDNAIMSHWQDDMKAGIKRFRPGDSFDTSNNHITWFARQSASCTNTAYISPALALGHELGHAIEKDQYPFMHWLMSKIGDTYYDTLEERRNITTLERPVEKELGEPVRYSHSSDIEYVNGPLDRFDPNRGKLLKAPN